MSNTIETQNINQAEDIFADIETDEALDKAREVADGKVIAQTEEELQELEEEIA